MKKITIDLKLVQKFIFLTLCAMFMFIQNKAFSVNVNNPTDLLLKMASDENIEEKISDKNKTHQSGEETIVLDENNGYLFSFDTKGNGILIKLFKKNMGNYLQFTQLPVKWIAKHRNNNVTDVETGNNDNDGWSSNINFDIKAGFIHHAVDTEAEQYIAVSGQLNKFYVGIILILTT